MSKELILKMCKEIVEGKQTEESGFDCIGIYCEDCPIGRFNNNGISCHDNTEENIIAAAKKYIAENTEFDWEEFKNGSIAVHCDTEEKAKDFLKKCDKRDIKWSFGEGTIKGNNRWNCYKEKTCYSWYFEGIIFENIDKEDLKIIKWEIKGKKEMKNKFKVGDKVKKINGDLFGEFRDKPHKVVTIEKIDDYSIWFKETRTNLAFCDIDEIEKVTENKTKLTFKEFVNEAEEGKIYVSRMGVEFYKEYKNIKIKLFSSSKGQSSQLNPSQLASANVIPFTNCLHIFIIISLSVINLPHSIYLLFHLIQINLFRFLSLQANKTPYLLNSL